MEHSIDEVKNRYFNFIGKIERKLVKKWCKIEMAKTDEQLDFLKIVQASLDEVKYDYWLPNIEPSIDKYGRIYYKEGDEVATDISCSEWKKKAEQFAPSCGSELANLYELYLWYALRIVNGFWTLEYVCNTSSNEYSFSLLPNIT